MVLPHCGTLYVILLNIPQVQHLCSTELDRYEAGLQRLYCSLFEKIPRRVGLYLLEQEEG